MIQAFSIRKINSKSLMKLLATDLTKFVNRIEIKTYEKDIKLSMIMFEIMRHPNFDIKVENKFEEETGQITVSIKDKRN